MHRVIYSPKYSLYNLGQNHPFSPLRNEILLDLWNVLWDDFSFEEPEIIDAESVKYVHDADYVDAVEKLSAGGKIDNPERYGLGTADNPIVPAMAEGARIQCAGTLRAAEMIIDGTAKRTLQLGGGFHHAHYNFAAGFCIYNDLALALRKMIDAGMYILYLDIDVHHCDGVQEMFYTDSNVLTVSLHESGEYIFPGSGWLHQLGKGGGRALKLNFPLEPFTEGESYIYVLTQVLNDALSFFRPDAVIVQAGADAHYSDPLADLMLTTRDYELIFNRIIELTEKYANGRMSFTLGGGYSMSAAFRVWTILYALLFEKEIPEKFPDEWRSKWSGKTGEALLQFLHDPDNCFEPIPRRDKIIASNNDLLNRLRDAVSPYWF